MFGYSTVRDKRISDGVIATFILDNFRLVQELTLQCNLTWEALTSLLKIVFCFLYLLKHKALGKIKETPASFIMDTCGKRVDLENKFILFFWKWEPS